MPTEITMPKLSDTMSEGHLGVWKKQIGDRIERGDVIAEVETDKATMDLEAFASGFLIEQRVAAGETVPVGTIIGLIGEHNEAPLSSSTPSREQVPDPETLIPITTQEIVTEQKKHKEIQAAPVVLRRAAELGVDLSQVQGSGPGGRIVLEDLEHSKASDSNSSRIELRPNESQNSVVSLSRMRSAIARITGESWQQIPHFYVMREIEMGAAEQLITDMSNEHIEISLNALIIAAAAVTLRAFPALNSAFSEEGIIHHPTVNISFAVAVSGGLQMPVVHGVESKGVQELTLESIRLAERAREGKLNLEEISGGSFSVSNLGMYGVDSFSSIIMPGQSAILAIGAIAERPFVRNGQIVAARTMRTTLSCDHRVIDGTDAAEFLDAFKELLEHPSRLPA